MALQNLRAVLRAVNHKTVLLAISPGADEPYCSSPTKRHGPTPTIVIKDEKSQHSVQGRRTATGHSPVTPSPHQHHVSIQEPTEESPPPQVGSHSPVNPLRMRSFRPNSMYEPPLSNRESWWRYELKETPLPGSYSHRGLTDDLEKRICNSSFRSSGRTRAAHSFLPRKGAELMPGQYNFDDFFMGVLKKPPLSSMRAPPRKGLIDANINTNVAPGSYSTEGHDAIFAEKIPSHHVMFKSVDPRASKVFDPKPGPPPGGYELPKSPPKHVIRSSFLSSVPRFTRRTSITPGPGAYGPMEMTPSSKILKSELGKQTGLFFTPGALTA